MSYLTGPRKDAPEELGRRVTVDRRHGTWLGWIWTLFNRRRGERRDGFDRRQRTADKVQRTQ